MCNSVTSRTAGQELIRRDNEQFFNCKSKCCTSCSYCARAFGPKVVQILKEGYALPFRIWPNLTRSPTVINCYGNPHRNLNLLEALHHLMNKNAIELVHKHNSLGFFNRLFLVPKPNNKWRPILDLSNLNLFLKAEKFKMETPETIRTSLQQGEWVTSRCLLPHSNTGTIQEILEISCPGPDLPVQSTSFRFINSAHGVHCNSKGGETDGHTQGYKDPPVPRRLVGENHLPPALSRAYTGPSNSVPEIGLAGEHGKVRTGTEASFQLCRLPVRPRVRPTPDRWQSLQEKILNLLSLPACPVGEFMSLICLLTATEKQVHLGRLHMRPIQWHLKNNWRTPESLEKMIPLPRSPHPHLQWWLTEDNVLTGQPLHPIKHALQIFTDASKEGWGAHLNEHTARGTWSLPESKMHINYLELKGVFLVLKEFQDLCTGKMF